jgi:hypothetical protein
MKVKTNVKAGWWEILSTATTTTTWLIWRGGW